MIDKPFDRPRPLDTDGRIGWEAEKQMAFHLARAFEYEQDVHVFNDLRFPTVSGVIEDDHVQIDHLVLHRHGIAIIESKATGQDRGEFHVDDLGQWQRRPQGQGRGFNISSPLLQAQRQCDALRQLMDAVQPPLLGKKLGLIQARFSDVPMHVFVAIADNVRLAGRARDYATQVMKAEQIVSAVQEDITALHDGDGVWFRAATTQRIISYLLNAHCPTSASVSQRMATPAAPVSPAAPKAVESTSPAHAPLPRATAAVRAAPAGPRNEQLDALTCRHCSSINVRVVHRKDYCLLCDECGKYTPLDWKCRECGRPATVRKRGPEVFRACDKAGGCGREVVFWRDGTSPL